MSSEQSNKKPKVASREAWLSARRELLQAEKELTQHSDAVARQRRQLPWVRVDKEYRFDTDAGKASLAPLGHVPVAGSHTARAQRRDGPRPGQPARRRLVPAAR